MTSILKHEVHVVLAVIYKQNVTEICIYKAEFVLKNGSIPCSKFNEHMRPDTVYSAAFCGQSLFSQHREFHNKN